MTTSDHSAENLPGSKIFKTFEWHLLIVFYMFEECTYLIMYQTCAFYIVRVYTVLVFDILRVSLETILINSYLRRLSDIC